MTSLRLWASPSIVTLVSATSSLRSATYKHWIILHLYLLHSIQNFRHFSFNFEIVNKNFLSVNLDFKFLIYFMFKIARKRKVSYWKDITVLARRNKWRSPKRQSGQMSEYTNIRVDKCWSWQTLEWTNIGVDKRQSGHLT